MPLKFRRGTEANRTSITPAEGEPIFTTDEKKLYIGDGTTAGGVAVGGGGGLGAPTYVVTKTADETVTNSTTLQDDDELYWNGFTNGKSYYIELRLFMARTNTSSVPGLKYSFDGNSDGYMSSALADGTTINTFNASTNANVPRAVVNQITITATANFTGTLRWTQNSLQSGTGIVLQKGSQMLIWEVA
jgi:hypothetical protein